MPLSTVAIRRGGVLRQQAITSVFFLMRNGSVRSVQQLIKFFEMNMMTEGRKTQIVLLDERRLEILIQPKLSAGELLDLVASHFSLKEKEYFGLSFKDDTGHHHWLQLDRRVLDHDFPKKTGPLVLYFAVRFFIETIAYLNDNATVELFYLQAKQSIFRKSQTRILNSEIGSLITYLTIQNHFISGHLECDGETAFELAAHVLQATYGDYMDDITTKKTLKKLPVLPTSALKEHPSIAYCEDRVIENYQKLAGQSRGSSIVNYMTIVESIPTYGIHYYEVKDKSGIPWWLGLSYKGVSLYDYADKKIPRRVFAWKQLENLYFRDKKFSIEVHDPKRIVHTLSSFNLYEDAIQEPIEDFDDLSDAISDPTTQVSVSRRTFGPGNVNVHAWLAATPQLTKCIWSMAVSQHQFYLDRKQSKSQLPQVRSMSEIAADLCRSTSSLQSSGASESISRSNSAHSLTVSLSTNNSRTELSADEIEASRAAQRDMYAALKARRDALEETLLKKTEILRELCIQEGELIGELPLDTPILAGEPRPQIRRRMGTEFSLSPKLINRDKASEEEEAIAKLELDFDIQDKIVKAAFKLAQDKTVGKTVRKQRKQSYHKSNLKLKDLEKKLNEFRKHAGKTPLRAQSSCEELSEDSREFLDSDSEFISPRHTPAAHHRYNITGQPQESLHRNSAPPSPVRHVMSTSRGSTPSPSPSRRYLGAVGALQTSGRMQYRPYDSRSLSSAGSHSEYEAASNGTSTCNRPTNHVSQENIHNWYNVNTTKTARYSSTDELKSPPSNIEQYDSFDDQRQWPRPPDSSELGYDDRVPMNHPNDYNCYDNYERNVPDDILLPELTPSKFGSKRESTSDYRDSKYHFVDMCPPVDSMPAQDLPPPPQSEHGYMPQHRHTVSHAPYDDYRGVAPTGERTPGSNIPFIDNSSSHGSLHSSSASSTNWYEPKDSPLRQQARPETPQYEPPPAGYVRQEPLPPPTQNEAGDHSESPVMTVTKFQSYVEVSKPFEMSDFYKYSEKLRRQRGVEHQSPPPPSSSHTQHRLQSPYMSRSANFTSGPVRGSQGYYSSNHHQPSSRSRPSSPFSQQQQQQQQSDGSYVMQQKVSSSHSFQKARTRQVPGNMVQQGTYHGQQTPGYPSTQVSPRHTSYQPPQPMTCEPVREPRPGSRSTPQTPHTPHRSMNDSKEGSFGSYGCEDEGVAEAFSEEMLAWYAGKGPANSSTLV